MDGREAGDSWDAVPDPSPALLRGQGVGASGFTGRLERWVADARIDDAARQRSREHWLGEVAAQEATMAGLLAELAERGTPIALHTTSDRRHHGRVEVVGADFVVLRSGTRAEVLVALAAVGVVRPAPTGPTVGDQLVGTELRLADVMAELGADRERVLVVTRSGDAVAGELRSAGRDVVVIRTDTSEPKEAYVAMAAIAEVTIG
jgi:hypothetical protein